MRHGRLLRLVKYMKKRKIWILLAILAIFFIWLFAGETNSDFATEALLEYHYGDTNISLKITDENDLAALKQILKGRPFGDSPSCGFSADISITMTNGRKSVMFCPANDGCRLLRVGGSGGYIKISDEARTRLNYVLEKYGMTFPCI